MFLLVLGGDFFHIRNRALVEYPGSAHKNTGQLQGRRGNPKGASPLCVVAEEGVTGEKPHRKGFSLRAVFWLLFVRTKSNPGCGAGSPIRFRKETCFSPPRPAMGESALHRPDALAQRHQNRGVGPEGPEGKVYIL